MNINNLDLVITKYCKLIKKAQIFEFDNESHQMIVNYSYKINSNLTDIKRELDRWERFTKIEQEYEEDLTNITYQADREADFKFINNRFSDNISKDMNNIFFWLVGILKKLNLYISGNDIETIKHITNLMINKSEDPINFTYPKNNLEKLQQINISNVLTNLSNVLLKKEDPFYLWENFLSKIEDFLLELLSFCQQIFPDRSEKLESHFNSLLNNLDKEGNSVLNKINETYPINLEDFDEEDWEY